MAYQDDPNRPIEPREPLYDSGWSADSIILASMFAIALAAGIFMLFNYNSAGPRVASNMETTTNAPSSPTRVPTQPRETTGTGTPSAPPATTAPAQTPMPPAAR